MQTTYTVQGMHCPSCVAKITQALKTVPGVQSADVSLDDAQARVTADKEIAAQSLDDAVRAVGDYRIEANGSAASQSAVETDGNRTGASNGQPRESLYPLILIVAYILGAVLLIAWATSAWSLAALMRHFMAGFFLVFSFFKLLDLRGFAATYRTYDLLAKALPPWAWAYPFVELALGIAYLANAWPTPTNVVTLALMLVGSAGVLAALLGKKQIRCACLGTALNLPMTTVTLVEDLTMAAMAAAMLVM